MTIKKITRISLSQFVRDLDKGFSEKERAELIENSQYIASIFKGGELTINTDVSKEDRKNAVRIPMSTLDLGGVL